MERLEFCLGAADLPGNFAVLNETLELGRMGGTEEVPETGVAHIEGLAGAEGVETAEVVEETGKIVMSAAGSVLLAPSAWLLLTGENPHKFAGAAVLVVGQEEEAAEE